MNKTTGSSNASQHTFIAIVMMLLLIVSIIFTVFACNEKNGSFAIASAICLSSLLMCCNNLIK